MTDNKPDLSKHRLVELPPPKPKADPPPALYRDGGAYFVQELNRLLAHAREAGLTDTDISNLITAFVPDFPKKPRADGAEFKNFAPKKQHDLKRLSCCKN